MRRKNIYRSLQKQAMEKLGIQWLVVLSSGDLLALIAYLYCALCPISHSRRAWTIDVFEEKNFSLIPMEKVKI